MLEKVRSIFAVGSSSANTTLSSQTLRSYNASRHIKNPNYLCHAPFNNMYFNSIGDVSMCWLTFNDPDHYSENRSIRDIWFGDKFSQMRENIKNYNLDDKCKTCLKHLKEGNFTNVLARAYDNDYPLTRYPSMMELELANTCNLECTMCNGLLSSSIRKNREKLPPLKSPYGKKFVDELKEFIPHLKELRFNGGEPFLIDLYYKIWDEVLELNPSIKMVIATNGTVLNNKVKRYLEKGNFHLNISIDALEKENYEAIRVNSNKSRLMKNFEYFRDYCHTNNRTLCVMINPMRQNWWEMPDFVNWCNEQDVHLWFNTIVKPEDQALWNLPHDQLKKVYNQLSQADIDPRPPARKQIFEYNKRTYKNLVEQQIKTWMEEAEIREAKKSKEAPAALEFDEFLVELKSRIDDPKKLDHLIENVGMDTLIISYREDLINSIDRIVRSFNDKSVKELAQDIKEAASRNSQ